MQAQPGTSHPTPAEQRTWRVGLTGGIASGKSAVADMFAQLGVPVIDTDLIAREVVSRGSQALQEIAAAFGAEVLLPDGSLDRPRLRKIVFQSLHAANSWKRSLIRVSAWRWKRSAGRQAVPIR